MQLIFQVTDTGPGIDPSHVEDGRIFDAFTQGDSSLRRAHEGLGLGLSLCKTLSDRMGGKFSVESQLGEGSTFTFKVQVREEES